MLEPREADIPIFFLFLVVLPVAAYVLLGKWTEASKKSERVSLLTQLAAEEALRAETMAAASVVHVTSPLKNNELHVCARCFSPATTRCSRCKSVRYCSGKCQITHWRRAHKEECVPVDTSCSGSSPKVVPLEDSVLLNGSAGLNMVHPSISTAEFANLDCNPGHNTSQIPMVEKRSSEKRYSFKSNRESSSRDDALVFDLSKEASQSAATCLGYDNNIGSSKEAHHSHKSRNSDFFSLKETPMRHNSGSSSMRVNKQASARSTIGESCKSQDQQVKMVELRSSNCQQSAKVRKGTKPIKALNFIGMRTAKLPKAAARKSGEHLFAGADRKERMADESSRIWDPSPVEESNGVASMRIMKMMGLRKSTKLVRQNTSEKYDDTYKNMKMLCPYEEFVKFFKNEGINLSPRGLVNCGNSCYANAVLQCLTCTKPLVVYLLRGSHSGTCCGKDWCLMCELEQHVTMLRESGGPLSPSRILSHMRSINCQIGDGSQEDAHEFLRLLVASMQSICLERLGGESKVDPRLQETTFVQHTFGGRLRSKVKCLSCHHESERYENIMDLTLEIYGWVESLEDALTQFTTPEDLDGENMYRCGRCAEYVRARKQLSIHEAPNILTIVLKRFQEGRYGKINKCITFPEMLDMIPFMTGTGDMPPLYMLYAVVVHLDTLNASFSGHYVSYVKDLQGNWFRIDDAEVHPVPMSQVMSEGAYILFYMRSYPRAQRTAHSNKTQRQQVPSIIKRSQSGNQKPSLQEQTKPTNHFVCSNSNNFKPKPTTGFDQHMEFSDATSSDWSLFTSSDEASFTTESTRDSFSTVDNTDACNLDSLSIFNNLYPKEPCSHNTVACRMFSGTKPETRFFSEEKGYALDTFEGNYDMYVNYGTNPGFNVDRTHSFL